MPLITSTGTTLSCTCGWTWDGKAWGATIFADEARYAALSHQRYAHTPHKPIPVWENETQPSSDGWTGD